MLLSKGIAEAFDKVTRTSAASYYPEHIKTSECINANESLTAAV